MSLRMRLKQLTRPLHDELEALPISKALLSGNMSPSAYVDYLSVMAKIHAQVESQLNALPANDMVLSLQNRRRLPLIITDLTALGAPYQDCAQTKHNQTYLLPGSLETLIGAMYVLEGSTLGGQVIARRLIHITGCDGLPVTRYVCGYQAKTNDNWQSFCQLIDAVDGKTAQTNDAIILGAMATFLAIRTHLKNVT